MYKKDFEAWKQVKSTLDSSEKSVNIRAGEVRWISIGVNVGSEIDGKGSTFTRPCIVLHVIGSHLALVAPLTSKDKKKPEFFMPVEFNNQTNFVCLSQIRVVSQKRIFSRIVKLSDGKLDKIKLEIFGFYGKKKK